MSLDTARVWKHGRKLKSRMRFLRVAISLLTNFARLQYSLRVSTHHWRVLTTAARRGTPERFIRYNNPKGGRGSGMTTKTKIRIKPLGDRVIAKVLESEEKKTPGGIYVPDTAKEKPQEADVAAVGNGKYIEGKLVPLDVKVGDRIVFGKYSGSEVTVDDEEYLILKESDILAVIE